MHCGAAAYAQTAQGGAPNGGAAGGLSMIVMMLAIFVIFYLVIFLPQRKKDKAHKKMLNELQKGDRILTAGGIYGTVASVDAEKGIVTVKIADKTTIEIAKSAIQGKVS